MIGIVAVYIAGQIIQQCLGLDDPDELTIFLLRILSRLRTRS